MAFIVVLVALAGRDVCRATFLAQLGGFFLESQVDLNLLRAKLISISCSREQTRNVTLASQSDLRFSNEMRLYMSITRAPSLVTLPSKGCVVEDCWMGDIERYNLIPRTERQRFYPADYSYDGLAQPERSSRGRPAVSWDADDGCWRYVVL